MIARAAVALGAVAAVSAPLWVANPYHLHVLIMAGIFTILALSLNLLLGYTGQLSLGQHAHRRGRIRQPLQATDVRERALRKNPAPSPTIAPMAAPIIWPRINRPVE